MPSTRTRSLARRIEDGESDGGFDVVAFGTGLRLSRHVRAGFTVNRWLNGYDQTLSRTILTRQPAPAARVRPRLPPEGLELQPRPDRLADREAEPGRGLQDPVHRRREPRQGAPRLLGLDRRASRRSRRNADSSESVELDFPSSFGFGLSWRPRDTLTLSADFTRTSWSEARILDYFELRGDASRATTACPPCPRRRSSIPELQYPTLRAVPDPTTPTTPRGASASRTPSRSESGVEWVLIKGALKVPLRAGLLQRPPDHPGPADGNPPRFNGFTAGTGLILGSVLLDVAWVYEFGEYFVAADVDGERAEPTARDAGPPLRNTLTTNRVYASIIYRFSGRWRP